MTSYETALETLLVDHASVEEILEELRDVCWEKGERIRMNWQDSDLAERWERTGNLIAGFIPKLERNAAPGITKAGIEL